MTKRLDARITDIPVSRLTDRELFEHCPTCTAIMLELPKVHRQTERWLILGLLWRHQLSDTETLDFVRRLVAPHRAQA